MRKRQISPLNVAQVDRKVSMWNKRADRGAKSLNDVSEGETITF